MENKLTDANVGCFVCVPCYRFWNGTMTCLKRKETMLHSFRLNLDGNGLTIIAVAVFLQLWIFHIICQCHWNWQWFNNWHFYWFTLPFFFEILCHSGYAIALRITIFLRILWIFIIVWTNFILFLKLNIKSVKILTGKDAVNGILSWEVTEVRNALTEPLSDESKLIVKMFFTYRITIKSIGRHSLAIKYWRWIITSMYNCTQLQQTQC